VPPRSPPFPSSPLAAASSCASSCASQSASSASSASSFEPPAMTSSDGCDLRGTLVGDEERSHQLYDAGGRGRPRLTGGQWRPTSTARGSRRAPPTCSATFRRRISGPPSRKKYASYRNARNPRLVGRPYLTSGTALHPNWNGAQNNVKVVYKSGSPDRFIAQLTVNASGTSCP